MRRTVARAVLLALACVPATAEAQLVMGRVVDAGSGAAVPQAQVVVTGAHSSFARSTRSGADGRFSLVLGGGGAYRLEVSRIGYRSARPRTLTVASGDTVRVAVPLSPVALTLEPLNATARPRRLDVHGVFAQVRPDSVSGLGPASARGAWGSVQVRGTFPTPSDCYQLAAAAHREGTVLTLVVEARPSGDGCFDTGGLFTYDATVRGLRARAYTLRIVHAYRDDVWESALALDTTVAVR